MSRRGAWVTAVVAGAAVALGGAVACGQAELGEPGWLAAAPAGAGGEPLAERLLPIVLEAVSWLWFFYLGAIVASFLNVVAWRWPRGESVLAPGSHCPACRTPLRWFDNLPIVGWLALRGRCRCCGAAIPVRYVLVEAALGGAFLALAVVEVFWGGWNLPIRGPQLQAGVASTLWEPRGDLLRIYAYHLALVSLLGTLALVSAEGQRWPRRLVAALLLAGLVPPLVWPDLRPVPLAGPGLMQQATVTIDKPLVPERPAWLAARPGLWGLADGAAGLAVGAALGLVGAAGARATRGPAPLATAPAGVRVAALASVGLYLGWQAAWAVALGGELLATSVTLVRRRRASGAEGRWMLALWWAVLFQLLAWRAMSRVPGWPGPVTPWGVLALDAGAVALLAWLGARLSAPAAGPPAAPAQAEPSAE